jgi:hypothetical protein
MMYATGKVVNGNVVLSDMQQVDQTTLTADCFLIQIRGSSACTDCENLNKPRKCGGMRLRDKYGVPAPVVRKRKPFEDAVLNK